MIVGISGKINSGKDTVGNIIQILIDSPHFTNEAVIKFLDIPAKYSYINMKFADSLKDMVCILLGCTREQLEDREFKEKDLGEEWWYYKVSTGYGTYRLVNYLDNNESDDWIQLANPRYLIKPTPRLLLQLLGTECGRGILHPNVWVNSLMSKYKPNVYWMCDNCMNDNIHKLIQIPNRFKEQGYTEDEYVCPTCKGKESEGDITMVLPDNYDNWVITDLRFSNELKAIKDRGGISIRVNRLFNKPFINEDGITITTVRDLSESDKHESETALDNATFDVTINNDGTLNDLVDKCRDVIKEFKLK